MALVLKTLPHPEKKGVWILSLGEGVIEREIDSAIFGKTPKRHFASSYEALEEFEEQFFKIEYRLAKVYLFRRLAIRGLFVHEARGLLQSCLVSDRVIFLLIEELQESGYLEDQRLVEALIHSYQRRRLGPRAIEQKLRSRGLQPAQWRGFQELLQDREGQIEEVRHLLVTRYKGKNLEDRKQRQQVIGSLLRRGFSWDLLRPIFEFE